MIRNELDHVHHLLVSVKTLDSSINRESQMSNTFVAQILGDITSAVQELQEKVRHLSGEDRCDCCG